MLDEGNEALILTSVYLKQKLDFLRQFNNGRELVGTQH